jgi:hypothetical protein
VLVWFSLSWPAGALAPDALLPDTGRLLYFGEGEPRDLIVWAPLEREDFLGVEPPGSLAAHAGLIGAVSCIGIQMTEESAPVVTMERLETGASRYAARLYRPRFTAVFDRLCSWWNTNTDDPEYLLQHEQIHFDLTESAARALTLKIRADRGFNTHSSSRVDALARLEVWIGIEVKAVLRATQERHEQFDKETSAVRSRLNQKRWEDRVGAEIAAYEKGPETVPGG